MVISTAFLGSDGWSYLHIIFIDITYRHMKSSMSLVAPFAHSVCGSICTSGDALDNIYHIHRILPI